MPGSLVALFLLLYLPALVHSLFTLAAGAELDRTRPDTARALHGLVHQVVLLGVLVVTWRAGWWEAADLGVVWHPLSIPAGLVAWFVLSRLHTRIAPAGPHDPWVHVGALRRFWPRGRFGQACIVGTLVTNPFTEELATRGVFVVLASEVTGSTLLALAGGATFNLALHAYQGARHLWWHLLFFLTTALLALSPVGLPAAIVLHFCADVAHTDGRGTLGWVRAARAART